MEHRRLRILFAIIALFAFGVIIWYFLFSAPQSAPTIDTTNNPLPIRTLPARFGFIFGGDDTPSTTETEVTQPGEEPFIQVWDKPTTGNVFATKQILKEEVATTTVGTTTVTTTKTVRATTTVLMFVDRGTGYVYGHDMDSHTTYQITNTTIPGVYDAYIWANGTKILLRYLDSDRRSIITLTADIPIVQAGRDPLQFENSTLLPKGVNSVAVSASSNALSYVVPNDNGSSIYTLTAKGITQTNSSFGEWLLSYGGEQLYATTKASAYVEGSTYILPSFVRVVGDKTGLVSIASKNNLILSSMWAQDGLRTFTTINGTLTISSSRTLASKCASGDTYFICGVPNELPREIEGLPDDWYQGRVQFDDDLVLLTPEGSNSIIYSFENKVRPMDVTSIRMTPKADLISFIKKQDGTLYLLNTALLNNG